MNIRSRYNPEVFAYLVLAAVGIVTGIVLFFTSGDLLPLLFVLLLICVGMVSYFIGRAHAPA